VLKQIVSHAMHTHEQVQLVAWVAVACGAAAALALAYQVTANSCMVAP
jgi:hypothetical protein